MHPSDIEQSKADKQNIVSSKVEAPPPSVPHLIFVPLTLHGQLSQRAAVQLSIFGHTYVRITQIGESPIRL